MNTSRLAAAAVVLVLTLWMASGLLRETDEDAAAADAAPSPMTVEIVTVAPAPMTRRLTLHGELEPRRQLSLRSETAGRIRSLEVARGDRVDAGAVLVTLDPGDREAALREARARVSSAESEQRAARSLSREGLQSQLALEQADAALEAARAALERIERDLANTRMRAPFAGVVDDLPLDEGALVERGETVATLVDDSAYLATARVAQQALDALALGRPVRIEPIVGEALSGTLSYIATVADPATRSFRVEAEVDEPERVSAAGVSATLIVPIERVEAVFVTPSVLALDDGGTLGVKLVDAEDLVVFVPVELVETAMDGAWVTGIPAGGRLITLGQGFVTSGERVVPQAAVDGGALARAPSPPPPPIGRATTEAASEAASSPPRRPSPPEPRN